MIVAPFENPVLVRPKQGGKPIRVGDAMSAAEVLLRRWPEGAPSPWRLRAMAKCLGALEGKCSGKVVQEAFLLAAAAAAILVSPSRRRGGAQQRMPGLIPAAWPPRRGRLRQSAQGNR